MAQYVWTDKRIQPFYIMSTIAGGSIDDGIQAVNSNIHPSGIFLVNGDEGQLLIAGMLSTLIY